MGTYALDHLNWNGHCAAISLTARLWSLYFLRAIKWLELECCAMERGTTLTFQILCRAADG